MSRFARSLIRLGLVDEYRLAARVMARENRKFLARAVSDLAGEAGIRQCTAR
jgi:hypothetical protein